MKLATFLEYYRVTDDVGNGPIPASITKRGGKDLVFVVEKLGGKIFEGGLYRVYRGDQIRERTHDICELFRAVKGKVVAFATDWLGRQFVLDSSERVEGKPTVVCLEPGVPDSFCTDRPILAFHNDVLVHKPDAALAKKLFFEWRKRNKKDVLPEQCVGYKVPLFLGGVDSLENLEMMDMDVYIHLCAQLWNKVKGLPEGTPIGNISLGH